MTLGAKPAGILSLILKQGIRPVMLGVIIGFAACAAASRFLSIMLYRVSPFDPLTFLGVSLFLTGIATLACYLPARRATRVDPMEALQLGLKLEPRKGPVEILVIEGAEKPSEK
jgi:ABC-type antimicrobial peptide transport system permease subunit